MHIPQLFFHTVPSRIGRLGDSPPVSDSSGHALSGTLLNSISPGTAWGAGRRQQYVSTLFNSAEGVRIADNDLLTPGAAATFEVWIKPDQGVTGQDENVIGKFDWTSADGFEWELLVLADSDCTLNDAMVVLQLVLCRSPVECGNMWR